MLGFADMKCTYLKKQSIFGVQRPFDLTLHLDYLVSTSLSEPLSKFVLHLEA